MAATATMSTTAAIEATAARVDVVDVDIQFIVLSMSYEILNRNDLKLSIPIEYINNIRLYGSTFDHGENNKNIIELIYNSIEITTLYPVDISCLYNDSYNVTCLLLNDILIPDLFADLIHETIHPKRIEQYKNEIFAFMKAYTKKDIKLPKSNHQWYGIHQCRYLNNELKLRRALSQNMPEYLQYV